MQAVRFRRFERASSVEETSRGLIAGVHGERLRLDLVRDDVVRVKISRGGVFDELPTFAVCADPLSEEVAFEFERDGGVVRLRTAALVVSLGLDPFRLDVHRPDGSVVVETARDADGACWGYATLNDAFEVRRRCRPEDAFYGLGEKTGRHNRRGREFTLWNTDVLSPHATAEFTAGRAAGDPRGDRTNTEFDPYYVSIPFVYHHAHPSGTMAGSFVDNGFRATYDLTGPEEYAMRFEGGQYTEYLFAGPAMADILEAYTWLTGRIGLPPLWSLGYHQCRWFRYTQDAVEAVARRHRELEVPCDAVWLDIEYMDGYRVFTWDPEAFPDAAGMLGRLADDGFRVVTIVDPGVKDEPGYRIFDEAMERDLLCRTEGGDVYIGDVWPGETAFPDFVTRGGPRVVGRPERRPRALGRRGGLERHERARHRRPPAGPHAVRRWPGVARALPQPVRAAHGHGDRRRPARRDAGPAPVRPLARRLAGIQRYAANWLGDNQSRWDHLWLSMPMAMGFGVSGQPFLGADVGGFQGHTNAELFLRWMQYGTLTPFCRNHSEIGNADQYAWAWGDVVLGLVRDAIALRYRLLPYLYAAFVRASETGAPVQRPLVFDHQDDPAVRDLDDEYLLGPDLLVAPVTAAGQTARQVYLPAGDWYDWHTGELVGGGRYVLVATPMDRIPLFARGGALVPMWPQAPPSTAGHKPAVVELHLFVPEADGEHRSLLQEDDGVTLAARDGARVRTTFAVTRRADRLTLRAEVAGDGFPEHARRAFRLVVHGAAPPAIVVDGERVGAEDGRFVIPNDGTDFAAAFDL